MQKMQKIYESNNSTIFKGRHDDFDNDIIIKQLNAEYPTEEQIVQFNNEYEFTKNLQIGGVNKALKKDKKDGKNILILEYFDGQTLKEFISKNRLNIDKFLKIACNISQIIGEVHQYNIIHKDINSNNILINEKDKIKIIDFGFATKYTLKTETSSNINQLIGTLQYISPEQTGRMNRTVDSRSDLYSLGVVLYELFTGKLPFNSYDKMELIHSHIAKKPVAPNEINNKIPEIISNIILKLLSKNAENRYQSAFGLKYDLEKINLTGFENLSGLEDFKIGEKDFSGKLRISEKLYGREKEKQKIQEIYEKVCNGKTELLSISGLAGVGKSALIKEVSKSLIEKKGIYIEGIFDEFQKDIPYTALIQAFSEFVNQLLNKDDGELEYWKKNITNAVGGVGKVITDLIPELELVIGKQAELPKLEGKEMQNRFNYVWSNFIRAIAKSEHPLIIFIDDLQWADNSTIELFSTLLSDIETQYLFCITAFREDKFDNNNLKQFDQIEGLNISYIKLENLMSIDVNALIINSLDITVYETLTDGRSNVNDFTDLVYKKTGGNPFFVIQFLQNLYEDGLLKFSFENNIWKWNLQEIQSKNITINVIKLMTIKFEKLSEDTKNVLKIASCIGNYFDLSVLSQIYRKNKEEIESQIEIAIIENLIVPLKSSGIATSFKFAHDRIRQAVYTTVSDEQKNTYHLQIARALLEFLKDEELEQQLFEVVNQYNYGVKIISDPKEKKLLAELNFRASQKAKSTSAYLPAYNYLQNASNLLDEKSWEVDYDFTLKIHDDLTQLSYLTDNYEKIEFNISQIKEHAKNIYDTLNSNMILISWYSSKAKYEKAVSIGFDFFDKIGERKFKTTNKIKLVSLFLSLKIRLSRKNEEAILNQPMMQEGKVLSSARIINSIGSPIFLTNPDLFPIITFYQGIYTLKYGNYESSPFSFAAISTIFSALGKYDEALKIAKIVINLIKKLKISNYYAKSNFLVNLNVYPWKYHIHSFYKNFLDIYQKARETGDVEFAAYSLSSYGYFENVIGVNLLKLKTKAIEELAILKKYNQKVSVLRQRFYIQFYEQLSNSENTSDMLIGEYFNEEKEIPELLKSKDLSSLSYLYIDKNILHYLFGNYKQAYDTAKIICEFTTGIRANYLLSIHYFYYSLSILAILKYQKKSEQTKMLKIVEKNQKKMKKWTKHCPENFQHKYDLVQAEKYRILDKKNLAVIFYNKAIEGANKNKFLSEEAISWELAGHFYEQQNNKILSKTYLKNAYEKYKKWGAFAKLKQLENKYSEINFETTKNKTSSINISNNNFSSSTVVETSSYLDLTSIVKASQSLSGEVKLDNLLKNMLMLIMENAGADYAVIITNEDGKYNIEAKGKYGSEHFEILQTENLEKTESVSVNIVRYVIRTEKLLVVDNAITDSKYSQDKYIKINKVKSIFCFPVIHKNKLVAVLYLENNLSTHVFTTKHIETINILSSQIAVSIENALLYKNLEDKVRARTEALNESNEELNQINEELKSTIELVKEQKNEIEESHEKITDSINYAKRIQDAVLPASELFENYFSEYFIFFKPRDVVSGDFYWAKKVNKYIVFAAADCTGHGVPGAFVSMLGISFLNELVRRQEITKASYVLNELRKEIKISLKQSSRSENKDGMDIALCVINTETNLLQYSGAYNPLYIVRNENVIGKEIIDDNRKISSNALITLKANRQPIGVYHKETDFLNHEIQLYKKDSLYIFSDGFVDQFGGDKGSKFYSKRFKELLLSIQDKKMQEQKKYLSETFDNWKGNLKQLDDVLVVGVKI